MSKSVESTRRELFEHEYVQYRQYLKRNKDGSYNEEWVDARWQGFNAALDLVEITFPPQDISHYGGPDSEYGPSYEQVEGAGYNHGLSDCKLVIETLNLGLKIK